MVSGKDSKIGFELLIDLLGFTIGLWVVGGGEGDVIIKKVGKFLSEGQGELGSLVGDDLVVKAKSWENMLKKDVSDVCHGGGFVARVENYSLQKTMVYHDQNRIVAVGEGEIRDEIHRDLLEGAGTLGGYRSEGGVGWVGVYLIGLAGGTPCDEFADKGGHIRPPVVFLE